jgi:signal transduction histidine kinase
MMHSFLNNNRVDLIERCRLKVEARPARNATEKQLEHGIPKFIDQLIRTLAAEQSATPDAGMIISGPAGAGPSTHSEIGDTASLHGKALLELGFSVDQVVHDYGDICQAITDLAYERDAPFAVDEFRTLNRCLDNAIAEAVTEFTYQRDFLESNRQADAMNERLGTFAHELRNQLNTATLAFAAAKTGQMNLHGSTGMILERSLIGLRVLIDRSLADVRIAAGPVVAESAFALSSFMGEMRNAMVLEANGAQCMLIFTDVDPSIGIHGDRDLIFSALANLIQNAIKFTQPFTDVTINAYAVADRVLIDVKDHCGGLPPDCAEKMFSPFSQRGNNRTGLGLGLSIARRSIEANEGTLTVRDVPGHGCVLTINLPRYISEISN